MHNSATTCMSDSSMIRFHLDLNHRCSIFKEELKKEREREGGRSPLNAFQKIQLHLPGAGAVKG